MWSGLEGPYLEKRAWKLFQWSSRCRSISGTGQVLVFPIILSYGISINRVWMWNLDHKEGWAPKNWYFETVVLGKTLTNPLDFKEIKPVNSKGNQPLNIHWKDWCWSWSSNTLATWYGESTHWKISWCWERLKAGGERGSRGWDG